MKCATSNSDISKGREVRKYSKAGFLMRIFVAVNKDIVTEYNYIQFGMRAMKKYKILAYIV